MKLLHHVAPLLRLAAVVAALAVLRSTGYA